MILLRSSVVLAGICLLLSGCALQTTATSVPAVQHLAITGSVHGGQQPVTGAHVSIMQGSAGAVGSASYDLIGAKYGYGSGAALPTGVTAGASGNPDYVMTDANGDFTITGDYLCESGGPVYLLATGGNPGLGAGKTNPALAELAVIASDCSTTLSPALRVGISEVSTVAGVYGLAGFMTSPLAASSSGTPLAITGFENAGATAINLVNVTSGTALARTAAGATIPVQKINLLADVLAGCVNSDGTGTGCSTLFANAKNGTATPTDTVTALLNIAHNPGANVPALFGLATASGPYQPVSAVQPTDLTLALTYPTMTDNFLEIVNPNLPTINAAGSVVLPGEGFLNIPQGVFDGGGDLSVLTNLGSKVFSNRLASGGGYGVYHPQTVAIDPSGNGWLANGAMNGSLGGQLLKVNLGTGTTTSFSNSGVSGITQSIVSDASGNIYQADNANADEFVLEYNNSGSLVFNWLQGGNWIGTAIDKTGYVYGVSTVQGKLALQYTGNVRSTVLSVSASSPNSLAIDSSNNLWVTNGAGNSISLYSVAGNTASFTAAPVLKATYSGGGLSFNTAAQALVPVVMDGASSAWVPNYAGNSISGFTNAGVALTPAAATGFAGGFQTGCPSKGLAVDGSGNIWVTCDIGSSLTGTPLVEFIGVAVPVATPILPGQLGVRP